MKIKTLLLGYAAWEIGWHIHARIERKVLFRRAQEAAQRASKPMLVVGAPYGQYGCGDINLDIYDSGECESHVDGSIERIPYDDKHFGAVFASHVLEHTCNPHGALRELHRVADHVFIAYPRIWITPAWASPAHSHVMYKRDGEWQFKQIRNQCNLPNYFGK
jgi:hypothetical protein